MRVYDVTAISIFENNVSSSFIDVCFIYRWLVVNEIQLVKNRAFFLIYPVEFIVRQCLTHLPLTLNLALLFY